MILEVTVSNFRKRIKDYFDAARQGERVVIRQGNDSFTLVPVTEDDLYFTPEMLAKIDKSIEQAKNGQTKKFKSIDELRKSLEKHNHV